MGSPSRRSRVRRPPEQDEGVGLGLGCQPAEGPVAVVPGVAALPGDPGSRGLQEEQKVLPLSEIAGFCQFLPPGLYQVLFLSGEAQLT